MAFKGWNVVNVRNTHYQFDTLRYFQVCIKLGNRRGWLVDTQTPSGGLQTVAMTKAQHAQPAQTRTWNLGDRTSLL